MKLCILTLLIFLFILSPVWAQIPSAQRDMEVTSSPLCTFLINRSDQTIMGTIMTMPQTLDSGDSVRHRENFKLVAGARQQFCTTGPFFEGRRVELIIRTLIPLFDCKTKLDRDIYLDAKQEDGFKKLSATCS